MPTDLQAEATDAEYLYLYEQAHATLNERLGEIRAERDRPGFDAQRALDDLMRLIGEVLP